MNSLVLGADEAVAKWVSDKLDGRRFGPARAIGVYRDRDLIAGFVYSMYLGHMVELSVASTDPRWLTRRSLHAMFAYPFTSLGVQRLQITIDRKNKRARDVAKRLGFVEEGRLRKAWDGRRDAMIYSMLPHECRWIGGDIGQKQP